MRPSSPREEACKRDDVIEDDGSPSKRIRVEPAEVEMTEPAGGVKRQLEVEIENEPGSGSPKRLRQLSLMPDGDENAEDFQVLSELEALMDQDDAVENEKPPDVSEEELSVLDIAAEQKEVERLIGMKVLIEVGAEAVEEQKGYVITTKMVNTWKHRLEAGGWFRRARLVVGLH